MREENSWGPEPSRSLPGHNQLIRARPADGAGQASYPEARQQGGGYAVWLDWRGTADADDVAEPGRATDDIQVDSDEDAIKAESISRVNNQSNLMVPSKLMESSKSLEKKQKSLKWVLGMLYSPGELAKHLASSSFITFKIFLIF